MTRKVVMIGTSASTQGGVAAVVSVYRAAGMFDGGSTVYVATHRDGGFLRKLAAATAAWTRYMLLLLAGRVALLHVNSASGPSFWRKFFFVLPTFAAGLPVVLHWHGGGFVDFYRRSPRWEQRLIGWVFRRSDRVIALSAQWHTILSELFPQARVVTIPNPVQLAEVPAARTASPPTLLFLGRVIAEKGVEDLLQAMPSVLAQVPHCRLVLAGTGDLQRHRDIAARLGVAHAVRFPGYVEGAAKSALLAQASVFVLPSHIEAMPMSVLEAMAHGLPVVATTVGGIPQAVRHGVDGLLFAPRDVAALADALVRVLSEDALRLRLADAARQRVAQNFAADLIVPKVRALWGTVFEERAAAERQ